MSREPHQSEGAKKVAVSGSIETRFSPEFTKQIKTGQEQEHAREANRALVEKITLCVVLAYTTIALWQGCSNQKSAEAAKSAADIASNQFKQSRDLYAADKRSVVQIRRGGNLTPDFSSSILVVNNGNRIARNLSVHVVGIALNSDDSPKFDYPASPDIVLPAMFPNDPRSFPVVPQKQFSEQVKALFRKGKVYFVIYGKACYTDDFGPHWTKFC
jgi:hypothetical protein